MAEKDPNDQAEEQPSTDTSSDAQDAVADEPTPTESESGTE